jgi:hypothetical protein
MLPRLITKPEQSGKTFIMLQQMIDQINKETPDTKKNINFVICDNNLLLVLQTFKRVEDEPCLESHVELSCAKTATCNGFESVIESIIHKNIRNVLCCSNHIRLKDINSIISSIHLLGKGDDYQFNIWFDEADKWLRGIDAHITPLTEEYDNVKLNLITATPLRIIKKYKKVEIVGIEEPTLPEYHGWLDSKFKIYADVFKTESFVEHVLDDNSGEIQKGTKWFIPGSASKECHLLIKEYCKARGFATIIINSEGIKVYLPDGKVELEKRTDMPDRLIPAIYEKYDLVRFPLAITGYFCVSRGITISSQDFQITHAIMPASMRNKNEMSQIAGRTKGNQKGWETYKPPLIFTTDRFHNVAKAVEKKTICLGKTAFKEGWTEVDIDKYLTVDKDYIYHQHPEAFSTYDEAVRYLARQEEHLKAKDDDSVVVNVDEMIKKKQIMRRGKLESEPWISKRLYRNKAIQGGDVEFLRKDIFDIMPLHSKIAEPSNMNPSYIILPVYKTKDSDVQFYVRHTKWK